VLYPGLFGSGYFFVLIPITFIKRSKDVKLFFIKTMKKIVA
jgi:hypothetical protein